MHDFDYLTDKQVYLDAACQSLRPRPVVQALEDYYFKHNSCGERVKYPWGEKTDALVSATRQKVLKLLKLKSKDYFVSFTLNTTYGINLLLNSIAPAHIKKIFTSEIEHNSPFLATMSLASRLGVPRVVLKREESGALIMGKENFKDSVVVINAAANFDGRRLENIKEVVKRVHNDGGIIIIDAAQAMAHSHALLEKTEADAICFSAHKIYATSLGVMVVRRDLIPRLRLCFVGGGMVDDVFEGSYILSAGQLSDAGESSPSSLKKSKKLAKKPTSENLEHTHTIFEPGLQAWGEIISLGAALDWLARHTKADKARLAACSSELYSFLESKPSVHLVNHTANPTMSFYVDGLDSHLLGSALGKEGIMARAGYFCAHYYLDKVKKYPPLLRFSLSYATRESDIDRVKKALERI